MNELDCRLVKDLMPLYIEHLVSEETDSQIYDHVATCENCKDELIRMTQSIQVSVETPKHSKKILYYLNGIRAWYFLCPTLAFTFQLIGVERLTQAYIYLLMMFSFLCISSYYTGLSVGFDYEQTKLQQEATKKSIKQWGKYRVSPFFLALPAMIVIVIYFAMRFTR